MHKFFFLSLCCAALSLHQVHGQTTPSSPARKPTKKEQREAKRQEEAKKKPDYDPSIIGHAYFESEDWAPGTVWYEGIAIRNTPLRYDLVRDEVTLPPDEPDAPAQKLRLLSEKVDSFTVHNHTFIRMEEAAGIPAGFYDRLYNGKVKVLARRQKYIFNETTYQRAAQRILTEDRYYLYKDGKYHQVKNQPAALKVLKDKKKELEKFIKSQNLDFRNNFEEALIQLASFYDRLSK